MSRVTALLFVAVWVGTTLVLADRRWFRRMPLAVRVRPYAPGATAGPARAGTVGAFGVQSLRDVLAPLAHDTGARFARALGVTEAAADRLVRIHADIDATTFRLRQAAWSAVGLVVGVLVAALGAPPAALTLLLVLGAPLLAFLVVEQQLATASARWQRQLTAELPVVCEQLGLLVSSGWSLGGAVGRVAARGSGCCARDLARVQARVRQGLGEEAALREWAAIARVDAVDRVVAVLTHRRDATDLGRMIAEEARSLRRDAHRRLIETIHRRAQLVWVPVTVAALVPGVLFIAVPFIEVMRLFAAS